jgi:hypothetical protein
MDKCCEVRVSEVGVVVGVGVGVGVGLGRSGLRSGRSNFGLWRLA